MSYLGNETACWNCQSIATNPDILLADEPFAAIDAMTREAMQAEMERIVMERSNLCF